MYVPALALLLGACTNVVVDPRLYDETDYFPLDGSTRAWSFQAAQGGMDWTLRVEKGDSSIDGDVEVVTLGYFDQDSSDLLWQVLWSNDPVRGVRIHGYTDVLGDVETTFSTPVVLVQRDVQDQPVVTRNDSGTFTASAGTYDGCGTFWEPSWGEERCLVVTLTDEDLVPANHGILTGEYRLVPSYGLAWMDLDAWDDAWWLSGFDWEE